LEDIAIEFEFDRTEQNRADVYLDAKFTLAQWLSMNMRNVWFN